MAFACVFREILFITGKSVKKPSNFKVRIGTTINELIEAAGGLPENCGKIINGGPMMGKAIANTEIPVTKGTSGILMMRRHFAKYFPGLPNFRELKVSLLRAETNEEVNQVLNQIVDIYGSHQIDYNRVSLS
ncbi:MAG: hypothetical protein EOM73_12640 [Bacteroidia bacterium]|nr:hypothetical protein [Bacteroidia bacterium]